MQRQSEGNTLKAATWYTASSFVSKSIIYICTPLYARLLSTIEYGQFNNYLSWKMILASFISLELGSSIAIALIDYKNKNEFEEFVSTISIASIIIPLLLSLLFLCFSDRLSTFFSMDRLSMIIMFTSLSLGNVLGIYQEEQRSCLKYKLSSILTITVSCGGVILTLILLFTMKDKFVGMLLGNMAFNVIISMVLFVFLLKRKPVFKFRYLKYALVLALPLIPHTLAATLLGSSDKVMIEQICGSEQTALYSLVYTVSLIIMMFINAINRAWVPWFYRKLSENKTDEIQNAVKKTVPLIASIAILICLIGPEIVLIIGGIDYAIAANLVPPIVLYCFVHYVYILYVNIEFFKKKTGGISIATVLTGIINVILNYVCIRAFDYEAAAYTTLFSEILLLTLHVCMVKKLDMLHVFNNKFFLISLFVTCASCFLILLTYHLSFLRYTLLVLFVAFMLVMSYNQRREIKRIFKLLLK